MKYLFRKAEKADLPQIREIIRQAIQRRKADGSEQWQDGYPGLEILCQDINQGIGYVLADKNTITGYCAVKVNDEPAYVKITGRWLSHGDFIVFHRIAVSAGYLGKGLAQQIMRQIEDVAHNQKISSIKADTNFDNPIMLHLFKKSGYRYCGEISIRGKPRLAYEKLLETPQDQS